jgi:hypothetical protein
MAPLALTQSQQSTPSLPGTWKLEAGRAITLRPRENGVLRVAHGRLWVTFDGPHAGPLNDLGDRVAGAGDAVRVAAGQRMVLEPVDPAVPAYFSWDVAPAPLAARSPRAELVLQPLRDLRLALVFGGGAVARLASGVVRLALSAVLPRSGAARRAPAC